MLSTAEVLAQSLCLPVPPPACLNEGRAPPLQDHILQLCQTWKELIKKGSQEPGRLLQSLPLQTNII